MMMPAIAHRDRLFQPKLHFKSTFDDYLPCSPETTPRLGSTLRKGQVVLPRTGFGLASANTRGNPAPPCGFGFCCRTPCRRAAADPPTGSLCGGIWLVEQRQLRQGSGSRKPKAAPLPSAGALWEAGIRKLFVPGGHSLVAASEVGYLGRSGFPREPIEAPQASDLLAGHRFQCAAADRFQRALSFRFSFCSSSSSSSVLCCLRGLAPPRDPGQAW